MRLRRVVVVAASLVVFGAACSSDGSDDAATEDDTSVPLATTGMNTTLPAGTGGADHDGFCALLANDAAFDPLTGEGQEQMAGVIDTAPDEVREPVEALAAMFERLGAIYDEDGDNVAAVYSLLLDPEIAAATEEFEAWGVENCGLEPGFYTGEP